MPPISSSSTPGSAFDGLASDQALIIVRGPWISLAMFSASLVSFGLHWRLGQASSDEFTLRSADSPGPGRCSLEFLALCKMGPALSSLRAASVRHPLLEVLLGYQDPHDGLEIHRFSQGRAEALGTDWPPCPWLSALPEQLDLWARLDHACHEALLPGGRADPSWVPDSMGAGSALREAMILMSGQDGADPLAWASWPACLGDCWSWTRSPWTSPPPWSPRPHIHWLDDLARMASQPLLPEPARRAAATKAVVMADQMARADMVQARAAISSILPSLLAGDPGLWAAPLSKAGRGGACSAFGLALDQAGVPLRSLFSPEDFSALASRHPLSAGPLLRCPPWGYDVHELEWLSSSCPAEFSSIFERHLLEVQTRQGQVPGRHPARL